MYTRRPIQVNGEPLRLPEHYSGVTFSRNAPTAPPKEETEASPLTVCEEKEDQKEEQKEELPVKSLPDSERKDPPPKKHSSLLGLSGREDILLLILALLLLDDEGGDDMLAYILLGLLVLG